MCGRFTRLYTWKQLHRLLSLQHPPAPELPDNDNVAPTQLTYVCRLNAQGKRELVAMRWGFTPSWSKDGKPGPFNARCETVATNGMFRNAFRSRRCVIPASGFYEWQKRGDRKQPYYIHPLNDELFYFAGIWESYGQGDQAIESFTILTTNPNPAVAAVHDRMPVIIRATDLDTWLGPILPPDTFFEPYPAEETAMEPIDRVGKQLETRRDPSLFEPPN